VKVKCGGGTRITSQQCETSAFSESERINNDVASLGLLDAAVALGLVYERPFLPFALLLMDDDIFWHALTELPL
jgi:hypothetical protein